MKRGAFGGRTARTVSMVLAALACVGGCGTSAPVEVGRSAAPSTLPTQAASEHASPSQSSTAGPTAAPSASAARAHEAETRRFADLVDDLSEPDTYFFSDNLVTNETSYLQVESELAKSAEPAGVYLGVGPEQNFTYIAATRPNLAFIVDIRRGNMLLHLLYRAAFEEAASRGHFVALLLGRDLDPTQSDSASSSISEVLAVATKGARTEATFRAVHERLITRVKGFGVRLADEDTAAIQKMHHAFFDKGLDLRFELHEKNGRRYPSLGDLLGAKSPSGTPGSFLATDEAFRFVQGLQRAGRVVPIVGDFAGKRALPQLASYLKSEGRSVSTFYVSNVEQYLLEPEVWKRWVENVRALPKTDRSLFVRAYLDQGKKHPRQLDGHRTATALFRMVDFESLFGDKKTASFYALCTEKIL